MRSCSSYGRIIGMSSGIGTFQAAPQPAKSGSVDIPLVLGGHSFITQLGNDPPASEQEQCAIVETCLNCGIRWIDTTYQPERIALGNALDRLGRRGETSILAWSFFKDFTPAEPVGEPAPDVRLPLSGPAIRTGHPPQSI